MRPGAPSNKNASNPSRAELETILVELTRKLAFVQKEILENEAEFDKLYAERADLQKRLNEKLEEITGVKNRP